MPAKLERCVAKVRKKRGTHNAYAICTASLNKKRRKR